MVAAAGENDVSNVTVTEAALRHLLHQEHLLFNPHLHLPVTENQWEVFGIAMTTFGAASVAFNAFIFVTLSHRNRTLGSSPLSLLLQCLSFYDVCVALLSLCLFSAPTLLLVLNGPDDAYVSSVHPRLVPYLFALLHMAVTGSDYLNLATAVERFVALDGAFRKRDPADFVSAGCTPRYTWAAIASILALTFSFNFPLFWEREAVGVAANATAAGGVAGGVASSSYEVVATALRTNELYIKLYRLTMEFLVFKATPWFAFFVLFLSLKDRVKFYQKRRVRKTLTVSQYLAVLDSRIVLGINALFYATNALPLYASVCHIMLADVSDNVARIYYLCIVVNSTMKLFVYLAVSHDFRRSVRHLFLGDDYHWMGEERHAGSFLGPAKVSSFVQARVLHEEFVVGSDLSRRNTCVAFADEEEEEGLNMK